MLTDVMPPHSPLLAIDVGNSRIKLGLFHDWQTPAQGTLPVVAEVMASSAEANDFPWNDLRGILQGANVVTVAATVNPSVLDELVRTWPDDIGPRPVVLDRESLPLVNETDQPQQTGIDRLLKGVAANVIRPAQQPMIVIDSGTATTVDWIGINGAFAGGAILPGLSLMSQALHDHTARLPLISSEVFDQHRPEVIGLDTVRALQSGVYWGYLGAVRELIHRLSMTHTGQIPEILITGGAGMILAREFNLLNRYHRDLTLQGMAIAARTSGVVKDTSE